MLSADKNTDDEIMKRCNDFLSNCKNKKNDIYLGYRLKDLKWYKKLLDKDFVYSGFKIQRSFNHKFKCEVWFEVFEEILSHEEIISAHKEIMRTMDNMGEGASRKASHLIGLYNDYLRLKYGHTALPILAVNQAMNLLNNKKTYPNGAIDENFQADFRAGKIVSLNFIQDD